MFTLCNRKVITADLKQVPFQLHYDSDQRLVAFKYNDSFKDDYLFTVGVNNDGGENRRYSVVQDYKTGEFSAYFTMVLCHCGFGLSEIYCVFN